MKTVFVRELKPDEVATTVFLVSTKEVRQKRTGEPYLSLVLSDRTGEIDCKMWDNVPEILETFDRDDFVKVKGLMQLYNNRPQFTVHKLRRVDDREIDPRDFFPASQHDPEAMWTELRSFVSAVGNRHIRDLLNSFLEDPDVATRYRVAPAAKSIHHAFRSGLLEHVLSLLRLSKLVSGHYGTVDQDLLTAGIVLHDIGKIYELSYDRGFGYSAEGQLLGHISIAIRMIAEKLRDFPDFPVPVRNLLEHMVLSHHGQLEFGSPRVPIFPEALLLHHLDDMDSKMECMRVQIEREPQADGFFSSYSPSLGRVALKKARYLDSLTGSGSPASSPKSTTLTTPELINESLIPESGCQAADTFFTSVDISNHSEQRAGNSGSIPSHTASNVSSPNYPGRPSNGSPPNHKTAPVTNSIFGTKLQQALQDERK